MILLLGLSPACVAARRLPATRPDEEAPDRPVARAAAFVRTTSTGDHFVLVAVDGQEPTCRRMDLERGHATIDWDGDGGRVSFELTADGNDVVLSHLRRENERIVVESDRFNGVVSLVDDPPPRRTGSIASDAPSQRYRFEERGDGDFLLDGAPVTTEAGCGWQLLTGARPLALPPLPPGPARPSWVVHPAEDHLARMLSERLRLWLRRDNRCVAFEKERVPSDEHAVHLVEAEPGRHDRLETLVLRHRGFFVEILDRDSRENAATVLREEAELERRAAGGPWGRMTSAHVCGCAGVERRRIQRVDLDLDLVELEGDTGIHATGEGCARTLRR